MAFLNDVDFTDSDLSNSNLSDANLDRTLLLRTNLSHAKLNNSSMLGAQFGLTTFDKTSGHINFITKYFDKDSLSNQLDHLCQQKLDQNKHAFIFGSITKNIGSSLIGMEIDYDKKIELIEFAINHGLFGDQKSNSTINWINYGISLFPFSNKGVPAIPLSKSQHDLIKIKNKLELQAKQNPKQAEKDFMRIFKENRKNAVNDQLRNQVDIFVKQYGSCYKILDLNSDASDIDINTQFKKLGLKCHPDKNNSDEAKEEFQKINNAKEILLNQSKREIHDQLIEIDKINDFQLIL